MREADPVAMVAAARLDIRPAAAETMRHAGARQEPFSVDLVTRTVQLTLAAWVAVVNGDDATLAAAVQPDAARWLRNLVSKPVRIAPRPRVTTIDILALDAGAEPPLLRVKFEFAGRRLSADPGGGEGETMFAGLLELTLAGTGPWQLSSGHVWTLDDFLGYVFTSRLETEQEYRRRAGRSPGPAAAGAPRRFRLVAGFAEHDERFGSTAEVEVPRDTAPTRDEAVRLVWPAVEAETTRALGQGDWRPSLNWLDLIELRDEPPSGSQ